MTNEKGCADLTRDDATHAPGARPPSLSVWSFRDHGENGPLPALRRYGGPTLAVVTPVNGAQFGLHCLGVGLPHTAVSGSGHWLRMDKPGEFDRILGGFLARVRAAGARRSREPGK